MALGGSKIAVGGSNTAVNSSETAVGEIVVGGSNSEIARAESADPAGPFAFKQVVRAPFAHNPTIRRLPKGGGFVIFFIGGNVVPPDEQADCTNTKGCCNWVLPV